MSVRRALTRAVPAATIAAVAMVAALASPTAVAQSDPGSLAEQIEAAENDLRDAQARLARTYEAFTAAEQRHRTASQAARDARARAERSSTEAKAAAQRVQAMQGDVDRFASASFRQGSTVGSVTAYLGSESPTEMLERASLLNAIGDDQLNVLQRMRTALDAKTDAERSAQAALQQASRNERTAAEAKTAAERAYATAQREQESAQDDIDRLLARKQALQAGASGSTSAPQMNASGSGGAVLPAHGTLTSTYGARWGTVHYGIDIANSIGTPIYSTLPGEVISSGPASGFGMWVRVQHDGGLITVYGHINESLVSVGQRVGAGQQIATIGNRGQSTGPHLHFEVHEGGHKIDPLVWLRSQGVSI
ncbi:M23 family metallopeptidase [Prauserella oleivorans]|uniref:M23 family metallopeptidase n=1 Tax=Prauserella oleivorans TaxID=1478153 RepID=A0ABW5W776_9PSEU